MAYVADGDALPMIEVIEEEEEVMEIEEVAVDQTLELFVPVFK